MVAGFRKRFFAWMLKKGEAVNHKIYRKYKRELFHDLQGLVVEVGPGTGVNFNYFPRGINWIGIEPNEAFHEGLKVKAKEYGIQATLFSDDAAQIPLPDNTADSLICTLVLCTVSDARLAVAEMKRVLKPGGRLIIIEHVAAPKKSGLRLAQELFNPLNRLIADGCNCNRETWTHIQEAGFTHVELTHHRVKRTLIVHSPHLAGFAIK